MSRTNPPLPDGILARFNGAADAHGDSSFAIAYPLKRAGYWACQERVVIDGESHVFTIRIHRTPEDAIADARASIPNAKGNT